MVCQCLSTSSGGTLGGCDRLGRGVGIGEMKGVTSVGHCKAFTDGTTTDVEV